MVAENDDVSQAPFLHVRLERSLNGVAPKRAGAARALGLRRRGAGRVHRNEPAVRGQIRRVARLVRVTPVFSEISYRRSRQHLPPLQGHRQARLRPSLADEALSAHRASQNAGWTRGHDGLEFRADDFGDGLGRYQFDLAGVASHWANEMTARLVDGQFGPVDELTVVRWDQQVGRAHIYSDSEVENRAWEQSRRDENLAVFRADLPDVTVALEPRSTDLRSYRSRLSFIVIESSASSWQSAIAIAEAMRQPRIASALTEQQEVLMSPSRYRSGRKK